MQNYHSRRILTIGIVILFIGVGIQPAFALNTKQSMVNKVIIENCGCGEVSDIDLVKVNRLLDKVEVYSTLLLVLYKYTPEIKDEIKELSIEISTLKEELAEKPICVILEIIDKILEDLYWSFRELSYYFYFFPIICYQIIHTIRFNIFFIGFLISCWEWPGPPTGTLIVKILDTSGGSPQSGVYVLLRNETEISKLTTTFSNGKAYFFFTPFKDWDVYVDYIFAGTVEFYQPKLDVIYYLDEI